MSYLNSLRLKFSLQVNRSRMERGFWGARDWFINRPKSRVELVVGSAEEIPGFGFRSNDIRSVRIYEPRFECQIGRAA